MNARRIVNIKSLVVVLGLVAAGFFGYESHRYAVEIDTLEKQSASISTSKKGIQTVREELATTLERLEEARTEVMFWKDEAEKARKYKDQLAVEREPDSRMGIPPEVLAQVHEYRDADQKEPTSDDFKKTIVRAIVTSDGSKRWQQLEKLGITLTNEDFRKAVAGIPKGWEGISELRIILPQWVELDPQAAVDWVGQLAKDTTYEQAVVIVASAWVKKDPEAVSKWVQTLPEGRSKDLALRQYVSDITSTDPSKAAEWTERIKDENLRISLLPRIAALWAKKDPEAAAEWVIKLPKGRLKDIAVQGFASQIAETDPQIAMEWSDTIEDEHLRMSAITMVEMKWIKQDPHAVSKWIETLHPGRSKDLAIQQLAIQLGQTDPKVAVEWGQIVEDENMRRSALTSIAYRWLSSDRDAATQWIQSAELPETTKKSLLSQRTSRTIMRSAPGVMVVEPDGKQVVGGIK